LLAPDPFHSCRRPKNSSGPPDQLCPSVFAAHPDWFVCRNASHRTVAEPLGATVYPCTAELINLPWSAQPCWSHPTLIQKLTRSIATILNRSRAVLRPVATISQVGIVLEQLTRHYPARAGADRWPVHVLPPPPTHTHTPPPPEHWPSGRRWTVTRWPARSTAPSTCEPGVFILCAVHVE
jgi:hypothetical protein